jgi:hypothetical protein
MSEAPLYCQEKGGISQHAWGCVRVPGRFGAGLGLRTTTLQKCAAVPRRARIEGS